VIIGCGGRSAAHIEAYQQLPAAQVVACCARTAGRREALGARYGLQVYSDVAEMLRRETPDLVHIVTGATARVELMTLVAEMKVPLCTVEKPIALGVADWRQLQALERSSVTKFAVCHQLRWHNDVERCRQALQSGRLGAAQLLHLSCGMNIAGQGTHLLNYGRALLGDPLVTRVFGNAAGWDSADPGHAGPTSTVGLLEFATGCRGLWTTGPLSPRVGDPSTSWQHVRVAAVAERGRVTYEEFGQWEVIAPEQQERGTFGGMEVWQQQNGQSQTRFHQAMLQWLEDGTIPGTNLKASLHEWAVVLALYQSALERRPITLADFAPPETLVAQLQAKFPAAAAPGRDGQ
jgi:predicted dehydrogenase